MIGRKKKKENLIMNYFKIKERKNEALFEDRNFKCIS